MKILKGTTGVIEHSVFACLILRGKIDAVDNIVVKICW